MKAAVLEGTGVPLEIREVPAPEVGPRDVLLRVHACGVCHSDLHLADGLLGAAGHDPFPLVPGHEVAGVVERVGAEVTHIEPGDRAGVYWLLTCGRCPCCLAGQEEVCLESQTDLKAVGLTRDGGYAELTSVPAEFVLPLPPGLEFAEAAPLFCAGLTAYAGLKNAGLRPGQRVAVLGVGGMGHLALQIAKAMDAEVIAVTSTEAKQELAVRLGADQVIEVTGRDLGARLAAAGGADVVLSTTLEFQSIRDVIRGLAPLGTLVLASMAAGRLPVDPRTLVMTQQRVIGSYLGSRDDLGELLELVVRHEIRPILEQYPLEEVNAVHQRLRDNQVRFRAVLTPN